MAKKKKRGMPTKTCSNSECGATMPSRTGTCPMCGTKQLGRLQPKAAVESSAVEPKRSAVPQVASGDLSHAVSFVRQVGGLEQAKSLLGTIEEIKNL